MGWSYDGPDRFFWPFIIKSDETDLVLIEEQDETTSTTISISSGTYWNHRDANVDSSYPSFLKAIEDALNNDGALNNTYEIQSATPDGGGIQRAGIKLVATTKDHNFQIDLSDSSNTTIPPQYIGFLPDSSKTISSNGQTPNDTIVSDYSLGGVWQTPKQAADKRSDWATNVFSSDNGRNARVNAWNEQRKSRTFVYNHVAAAHVFGKRSQLSEAATEAGIADDDENNGFEDMFRAIGFGDILVLHGKGDEDVDGPKDSNLDLTHSDSRNRSEAINFPGQNQNLRSLLTKGRGTYGSEYYDIQFEARVMSASGLSGYDH